MALATTQDDVPSISITKLVASGVVRKDMSFVCVELNGVRRCAPRAPRLSKRRMVAAFHLQ
jgi:hypothetical protein